MAYRDLTKRFMTLRNQNDIKIGISNTEDDGPLLADDTKQDVPLHEKVPPQWVELLDDIDFDISKIEKLMNTLKNLHNKKSRVTFENTSEQDQQIQEATRSITRKLQTTQSKLKKIATIGNEENKKQSLPYQERMVRVSVMRSRGLKIQELSKKFRKMQKDYLMKLSDKNKQHSSMSQIDMPDFRNIEQGFTREQQQQLRELENDTDQRTKDIVAIAKSVQELAQLFNELSLLVVEQGSLLDRIDYNVEQTVDSLKSANEHIKQAEKYQKRSRTALCILVLIMLVFVCAFILIILNIAPSKN